MLRNMRNRSCRSYGCVFLRSGLLLFISCIVGAYAQSNRYELGLKDVIGEAEFDGFQAVLPDHGFVFPRDHGQHPDFRHEWWYLTGHLETASGREFGYQFTLFRFATAAEQQQHESSWFGRQLYMAHFALSDFASKQFIRHERFSRAAIGLAGAEIEPFKVWLRDWRLEAMQDDGEPPWQLHLTGDDGLSLSLTLNASKPRILQGDQGYSVKGSGGASYYYSYTNLMTEGKLQLGGESFPVHGKSWFDREWGSGALAHDQVGWDWFSLQLDDGRELMWYQLRLENGRIDTASQGVIVDKDGSVFRLDTSNVEARALSYWRSSDQRCYPISWSLSVLDWPEIRVVSQLPNQWWDSSVKYWEGSVDVLGSIPGKGYLELSGYEPTVSCGND